MNLEIQFRYILDFLLIKLVALKKQYQPLVTSFGFWLFKCMLAISDVNASHDKINLIEELKDSFRNRIANTANEGSVVLINNVPSVGDVIGNLDFLISLSITKKYKNYLVETISGNNIYIDNFILALKKIDEKDILGANEEFLYTDDGELNYLEIVKKKYLFSWKLC